MEDMKNLNRNSDEPIDPRLEEMLGLLRQTPQRDPEAFRRGRANFVAEVDTLFQPEARRRPSALFGWLPLGIYRIKETLTMTTLTQRTAWNTLAAALVIFIFLFGGASMTAYAAQSALPGDALYPVKTGLEQTQANLAGSAAQQAEMYLRFAGLRLDEIAALIDEGRYNDINAAAAEFDAYIQKALEAVNIVAESDPARASELLGQISEAQTRYADALRQMLNDAPDAAKPVLEHAIDASNSSAPEGDSANGNASDDGNTNNNSSSDGNADDNANTNDDSANNNSSDDGNTKNDSNANEDRTNDKNRDDSIKKDYSANA